MRFSGKIYKDDNFWLAEIPILDLMTQGETKEEACEMVADMVESMVNRNGFKVTVYKSDNDNFEIGSPDSKFLVSFLLQRKRQINGLSLAQVSSRLGMSSRNSYARYEQGKAVPSIEKLNDLFHAVSPDRDMVIGETAICQGD